MSRVAHIKVARRYAAALFESARKQGKTDSVQQNLATIEGLWKAAPDLKRVLESPLIPDERKHEIIDQTVGKELDPLTSAFLHLLVDKRREVILLTVRDEFVQLADAARGLVRAEATVAAAIDDVERAALVEALERRTGKQIELTVNVNPEIIGGVVVRMQDTVIDGSVRGSLERIREQMLHER